MNLSTLLGLVASLTVFILAVFTSSKNFMLFLDFHAILIVIGGTIAASLVCFSLPRITGLVRVFGKRILGQSKRDYHAVIKEIVSLSESRQRGRAAFETALNGLQDPFLKDASEAFFWLESEVPLAELRSLLETRAETHFERYINEAEIFKVMSRFPPAFGLLGTTLGMIALLQTLGKPDAKSLIGPSMSIALVATLYGIVLSNFIFIPIAENLVQQSKEDLIARRIVVEGIMLIAAEKPTQFVEEKIKSYLLPSERGPKVSGGISSSQRAAA